MNKKMTRLLLAALALTLASAASLAKQTSEFPVVSADLKNFDFSEVTTQSVAKRSTASAEQATVTLRNYVNTLSQLKSGGDLDQVLSELDTKYTALPADAQLLATQLAPLQCFRGLESRMKTLGKNVTDATARRMVTDFSNNTMYEIPHFSPQAVTEYITKANFNGSPFKSSLDLQSFVASECQTRFLLSIFRLRKLKAAKTLEWNPSLLSGVGESAYVDFKPLDFMKAEARLMGAISWTSIFVAYDLRGYYDKLDKLESYSFYLSQYLASPPESAKKSSITFSAKKVTELLKKNPDGLNLFPQGPKFMLVAYKGLAERAKLLALIEKQIVNPAVKKIEDPRVDVLSGPTSLRDSKNRTTRVDLPKFFAAPPSSLASFLPTEFDAANGAPVSWNVEAYRSLFPDAKTSGDIAQGLQILRSTLEEHPMNLPFLAFSLE